MLENFRSGIESANPDPAAEVAQRLMEHAYGSQFDIQGIVNDGLNQAGLSNMNVPRSYLEEFGNAVTADLRQNGSDMTLNFDLNNSTCRPDKYINVWAFVDRGFDRFSFGTGSHIMDHC